METITTRGRWDHLLPEEIKDVSIEHTTSFPQASNAFAVDLWKQLHDRPGNLTVSPASLSVALAMTWVGARGATSGEIARTLGIEGQYGVHDEVSALLRSWNEAGRDAYELRVVNGLFGERGYAFEPNYLEFVQECYGAPLEPVDFHDAPEPTRVHINAWVADRTAGKIPDLLPPGSVRSDSRLILTNAVYFCGEWEHPFLVTIPAPFHLDGGKTITVPTMVHEMPVRYCELPKLKIAEMHYSANQIALTILLPDDFDGLDQLERRITPRKLDRWIARLSREVMSIELPRFIIEPSVPLAVKGPLADMGIQSLFDAEAADLTGIANPPDEFDRLFIDEVYHQAHVDVDESGTIATVATGMAAVERCTRSRTAPPTFMVDHPFMFLIRDLQSGTILFMGHVRDPRSNV